MGSGRRSLGVGLVRGSWSGGNGSPPKRAAFADEVYWGRPVPGLATRRHAHRRCRAGPAAHGANRTGRVFTGDRSGDWLFRALHRAGLANQPHSVSADDGLELNGVWIAAAVRCAPPDNKPTPVERDQFSAFLDRELDVLRPTIVVCLGAFGFGAVCRHYSLRPRPRFGHGVQIDVPGGPTLLCSYHPSQQNTFTGQTHRGDARRGHAARRMAREPPVDRGRTVDVWPSAVTSSRKSASTAPRERSRVGEAIRRLGLLGVTGATAAAMVAGAPVEPGGCVE